MAPGRRKGGNRGKAMDQLNLGDLVLAKVKGFPAWPAKISNPEEWEQSPDPKKYFVQFFGTSEIKKDLGLNKGSQCRAMVWVNWKGCPLFLPCCTIDKQCSNKH